MSDAREGSLAELDLPRFLAAAFWNHSSGVLRAVRRNLVIEVLFLQGWIEDVNSSAPEDDLGRVLLQAGKVSQEQLRLSMETLEPGDTLGNRLVRLGFLTSRDLSWARKRRGAQIAVRLLGWDQGTFRILRAPPGHGEGGLHLNPLQIVVGLLLERGDPEACLAAAGNGEFRPLMDDEALLQMELFEVPEEYDLLAARMDGRRTLDTLLRGTSLPPEDALRFVHALDVMGLMERAGEAPAPRPSAVAEAPAPPREPAPPPEEPEPAPVPPPARKKRREERPPEAPSATAPAPAPGAALPQKAARTSPRAIAKKRDAGEESLVGQVIAPGTVVEVVFSVGLLAALLALVLFMGKHYLPGLRGDLDETRLTQAPLREDKGHDLARAFPPGSARRVLGEVEFHLLDEEPPPPREAATSPLRAVIDDTRYHAGLEQFRRGNYGSAAERWAAFLEDVPARHLSWRLTEACEPEAIRGAAEASPPGFLLLPWPDGGNSCFLVLWGIFPDEEEARTALRESAPEGPLAGAASLVRVGDLR